MTHEAPDVVIPLKKHNLIAMAIGAMVFVVVGGWLWSVAETQPAVNPRIVKVVSLASIGFFGACAIYLVRKLFDPRPGLIVDGDGIVDHSSAAAVGRIAWADVTNVKINSIAGQEFVTIEVADPKKYTARGGFLSRKLHAANVRLTGSPINISANLLPVTLDEVMQTVAVKRARHRALARGGEAD